MSRARQKISWIAAGALLPAVLILLWDAAVRLGWWPRTLIASPGDVVRDFAELAGSGELFAHAQKSLLRLILGFGLGSLGGILVGTWVGVSKWGERILHPTLAALSPIPPTAWIPLLIITLGIEESSKVGLIAIGAFIVLYANTVQGIRGADRQLVEVAQVFEKPKSSLIAYVLLPAAAPAVFAGMRVALGLSWILLIAAELVSSRLVSAESRSLGEGLGWLIYDARRFSRMDDMIVGMISIGLLGAVTDWVAARVQRRVLRWRQTFEGA